MSETSTTSRVLRQLDLLQARRYWTGPELAERLQVSVRTLRRDVDRLRELGYRVGALRGSEGGYRLESGSALPPMVFTDGEAIAIAVGLGTAAAGTAMVGLDELALSALAKVEQVLPARLRGRVSALRAATAPGTPLAGNKSASSSIAGTAVDPETLARLALACRDSERLRLRYRAGTDGAVESDRHVEPVKLVPRSRRWYLVCWDLDRDDWRTLRVDRIGAVTPTGARFTPRPLPIEDAAAFVDHQFGVPQPGYAARIVIHAPIEVTREYLGGHVRDLVADGAGTSWRIRDTHLELLAGALVWLPWPFHIEDSPELVALVEAVGRRFVNAGRYT